MPNPFYKKVLETFFPSVVIPSLIALFLEYSADGWLVAHEPFHAVIETAGSFAAIILSVFIIIMRSNNQLHAGYIWISSSLVGMGLLDGFHAAVHPGNEFVWLHSVATLIGGVVFALVITSEKSVNSRFVRSMPYKIAIASLVIGMLSIMQPSWIPIMTEDNEFTRNAIVLNGIGSAGFMLAGLHFFTRAKYEDAHYRENILLSNHCLLFGTAGLLFEFSSLWDSTWWLWHGLRLVAYLILLWFFVGLYYKNSVSTKENEEKYRSLVSNIPGVVYRCKNNSNLTMIFMSDAVEVVAGYKASEFINDNVRSYASIVDAGDVPAIRKEIFFATKENRPFSIEYKILDSKANIRNVVMRGISVVDGNNGISFLDGTIFDITSTRKDEEQISLFKKAFETTGDAIYILDDKFRIININPSYENITGYSKREVDGSIPTMCRPHYDTSSKSILKSLSQNGVWRGEIWDVRKNGETFPCRLTINRINDSAGKAINYIGIFQDITEEKEFEKRLEHLAYFDQLTNIYNRVSFNKRLDQNIADAKRRGTKLAVILIDLDKFKYVNDTLGHAAGDRLLQIMADRLKDGIRQTDTVARLGGDEFVIIVTDLSSAEQVTSVVRSVVNDMRSPLDIDGHEVQINGSIGISIFPDDGSDVSQLVKHADLAMYEAKERGGNGYKGKCNDNYCFYSDTLQDRIINFINAENELRRGIENSEFTLYYQPKFNLDNGSLVGVEALARWNKPEKGVVLPDEFIPLAEDTSLIDPLGRLLCKEACRQMAYWNMDASRARLKLSVNLSARQFTNSNIANFIGTTLDESGLDARFLELEITESTIMKDVEKCIENMHMINKLGVSLAVDDFGTGYSSLNYLKRFPIDTIKIDKSFVRDLGIEPSDADIIKAIIDLARGLRLDVVAEGIETKDQFQFLKSQGCQIGQGYLFGKPIPANEFERQYVFSEARLSSDLMNPVV